MKIILKELNKPDHNGRVYCAKFFNTLPDTVPVISLLDIIDGDDLPIPKIGIAQNLQIEDNCLYADINITDEKVNTLLQEGSVKIGIGSSAEIDESGVLTNITVNDVEVYFY